MPNIETLRFLVGLALLLGGAEGLVRGASRLAAALRISPLVIGLTVVAFGTSSPELAASLTSALAGSGDLALGNVVGSNIFNIGSVLGLTALITPGGVPVAEPAIGFDIPFMVAVALSVLPVVYTHAAVGRWEGGLFVGYYVAYTGYLLLDSAEHEALPRFGAVMLGFVVPLTVLTLGALSLAEYRRRTSKPALPRGPSQ